MSIEELIYNDFEIHNPEILLQRWNINQSYNGYEKKGRFCDGLMLVTGNKVKIDFLLSNGEMVHAEKNSLIYLPEGARYVMCAEKISDHIPQIYDVLFNFHLTDENGRSIKLFEKPCMISKEGECFEEEFNQLLLAYHAPRRSMVSVKAEAYRLFCHILSVCSGKSENAYPIRSGVTYLEQCWNTNVSVSYLASLCGMSESYFRRLFQRYAGMSPVQYRNSIRISAAKSMLSEGKMTVAEIAETVGFEDCFYFSRVFKKAVGMSPSAYASKKRQSDQKLYY